jgi:hypothetical protein
MVEQAGLAGRRKAGIRKVKREGRRETVRCPEASKPSVPRALIPVPEPDSGPDRSVSMLRPGAGSYF